MDREIVDYINTPAEGFERVTEKVLDEPVYIKHTFWDDFKRELLNNKLALFFLILLLIVLIASILAPLSPYDPNAIDASKKLLRPTREHLLGTDDFGRDTLTRLLYGGRVSLSVGFSTMLLTSFVGVTIGVISGFFGGKIDEFLMRFTDVFLALPSMLLMIILNAYLQPGLFTLISVLSLFSWAQIARITRAETMSLKERDFVLASKNLGASNLRITIVHIIPNMIGPITVAASLSVANAILTESTLSFLGLGVQVPQSSWGSMLQGAQAYILDAPMQAVYPGLLIFITVLSFNLLGDVLRVALEPKVSK